MAEKAGVPPWVLEGYPAHRPPWQWIMRLLVYEQIEASAKVHRA